MKLEQSLSNKKKLFLDADGVILSTIEAIRDLYAEDFRYYKDYKPIDWHDVQTWDFNELTCADKKYIDTYFNTPRFFKKVHCMPHFFTTQEKLVEKYDIYVVSCGYSPNLKGKEIWFQKFFPKFTFIPVNFKQYSDKSHVDMAGGIFIDDSANNLMTSNADTKICFGEIYPWNKSWGGKRCYDWWDVEKELLEV